jgi:hypothetical protein
MHTLVKIIISVAFSFATEIIQPETKTYRISNKTIIKEAFKTKSDTITSYEKSLCLFKKQY